MMQNFCRIVTSQCKQWGGQIFTKRQCSGQLVSISESLEKGNYLFSLEQKRQLEAVGRVEKISIEVLGPPENTVLQMNQNISTPYDCCRHISLPLCHQSPLAVVNDTFLWDMHRPLPQDCSLRFLSFRDKEPFSLNEAFWRTGSLVLGAVIIKAFKEEVYPELWRFPDVKVNSGSFIYDVVLNLRKWVVTSDELKVLSGEFLNFVRQNHKIERLDVKKSVAVEIFEAYPNKISDIKRMASQSQDNLVTLYRVGDHIDVCNGPMIGDTSFFGRCTVTSVHSLQQYVDFPFYRFQAVALPKGILLNSFAYGALVARAQSLNEISVDGLVGPVQPYPDIGAVQKNSERKVIPDLTVDQY